MKTDKDHIPPNTSNGSFGGGGAGVNEYSLDPIVLRNQLFASENMSSIAAAAALGDDAMSSDTVSSEDDGDGDGDAYATKANSRNSLPDVPSQTKRQKTSEIDI